MVTEQVLQRLLRTLLRGRTWIYFYSRCNVL